MSARDQMRAVQVALGLPAETATGIPNDGTKEAFEALWDLSLSEYRNDQGTPRQIEPAPHSGSVVVQRDGWIEGVKRELISGGGTLNPIALVIHFTAGASGQSSIDYWRNLNNGVCAHFVIERDGTVIQCRPCIRTCGHVGGPGQSRWKDPTNGTRIDGFNSASIGIELANAGEDDGALSWAKKQPGFQSITARHRNGGPMTEWEAFYPPQIAAVTALSQALTSAYRLHDLTGHDCVAPERRSDPGPAFDIVALREACGFSGLPAVFQK